MLQIKHLTAYAGEKKILDDISMTFEKGNTYVILGPNGSGKSTLAHTLMGNPAYRVNGSSSIRFQAEEIIGVPTDKRAQMGMFLSYQTPISLKGISVFQLLRIALKGSKDPLSLRQELLRKSKEFKIKSDVLERSLNEGASGGEKKKMEILQAAILNPKLAIFDEVDTGVDIDALKIISAFINDFKKDRAVVCITHSMRLLRYITPDRVIVLKEGKIVKSGGEDLAKEIEEKGFGHF